MSETSRPYPNGNPAWVELVTPERETAMDFYRGLFGWDYEIGPPETGHYTVCTVRGLPAAAIGEPPPGGEGPRSAWTTYLSAADCDECSRRIEGAGGKVALGPFDIADEGRMALAADPTGALFGLWQAGRHIGARVVDEHGALCWNELNTYDPEAARRFYREVFGYDAEPGPGCDATVFTVGGRRVAGVVGIDADWPAGPPSHWMTYFAVDDAEAAVRRATAGGATVRTPPFDSPYGRIAVIDDPVGAVVSLIEPGGAPYA